MRLKLFVFLLLSWCTNAIAQVEIYSPALPFTGQVNSKHYERSPVMHPSGEYLYFVRANDPANAGGIKDKGDIWMSRLDSTGNWMPPVNLGKSVNNEGKNTIIGFLNDGDYMLIAEQYGNKRFSPDGIAISEYRNGQWMTPQNIEIPYFDKQSDHITGSVTADGEVLLLSMQSFGSYGVEDLYISERRQNGEWKGLVNLGKVINSEFQEVSGYLTTDGDQLIFASNRKSGIGSFDLWVSERKGNSWRKWSEPRLLSDLVNSDGAEADFSYFPGSEYAFFISTRNSDGYGDIKQVKVKGDSLPEKVTLRLAPNTKSVGMKIAEARSGKPLNATVSVRQIRSDKLSQKKASTFGEVKFIVQQDDTLDIVVDKIGYLPRELKFDMNLFTEDSILTIEMEPLEVGNTVRLEHILFKRATDQFTAGSETELNLLFKMMTENPDVSIFLEGHTDSYGNPKSNLKLSQKRVDAVKAYLVKRGIDASRIEGKGFGGTQPVADNADEETRKLNRRVEFRVTAN